MHLNKHVVVGGRAYADIDVLACISAYSQLLNLKNIQAYGVITGSWNQTIPPSIKKWETEIKSTLMDPVDQCCFILVDLSDPQFMEEFVSLGKVVEVYDHHYGFEAFWEERLPNSHYIEKVGACATLIWEKFKENGLQKSISPLNANLLYTAIFANTLNFKSNVTDERDLIAFEELSTYKTLPDDWKQTYYQEIAKGFENDLAAHVKKDTKTITLEGSSFYFGQIEAWNASPLIEKLLSQFTAYSNEEWLINIASIEEGCSYLYTNSTRLRQQLIKKIELKPLNPYLQITPRLWLRKEILRELFFS